MLEKKYWQLRKKTILLPPFLNIRYFRFVKQMYLDPFSVYIRVNLHTRRYVDIFASQS
jgi:hypothetical protein